jgi:hypothetical protein
MTDDLERCEACRGTKKLLVMGGWEKSCPECSGIGWKAKNIVDIKKKPEIETSEPKKRMGRPPKNKEIV